ncbi:hypothetical protein CEXT_295621 [Caerostris extrusa]|uniref:Uncharacterized protein n=1 Tax=Caerostris extrusa TaxID=172846 RepID=A0AAV4Y6G6_CAEEX|nr:hypothetical protein CEXT_295621 [Caerostris extrusa]
MDITTYKIIGYGIGELASAYSDGLHYSRAGNTSCYFCGKSIEQSKISDERNISHWLPSAREIFREECFCLFCSSEEATSSITSTLESALKETNSLLSCQVFKAPAKKIPALVNSSHPEPECRLANAEYFAHRLISEAPSSEVLRQILSALIVGVGGPTLHPVNGASYLALMNKDSKSGMQVLLESLGK